MRLGFFIFKYFPYGGLERDMLKIALACIAQGYEVVVYTTQWEGEIPQRLKINLVKKRGVTNHGRMQNFSNEISQIKEKYDLRVGFNKLAGLDLCFVGDVCFQCRYQKKHWFFKLISSRYKTYSRLERAVFSQKSKTEVILLSAQQKVEYQFCYKTPENRLHLLPPGIQKNNYSLEEKKQIRQEVRENFQVKTEKIVLLFVASSFYTKGLDRVLQALAKLNDPRMVLWIVGRDKIVQYQKLARSLQLLDRVVFLGAKSTVQSFMLGADIFVNPARVESAGKAILEALTMELPVIITANCGYSSHVIDANAGIIIPENFDLNDLVVALQEMANKNKRKVWGENALHYSRNTNLYALDRETVQLIELLYKKVT